MVLSTFCFAVMMLTVRITCTRLHPMQAIFTRSLLDALMLLPFLLRLKLPLHGNRPRDLILRGVFGFSSACCIFYSVTKIPVAEATALFRTTPLFMPFVAAVALKEELRGRRILLAVVGFIGVLFILKPGSDVFSASGLIALLGGLLSALAYATLKHLTDHEHPLSIIFALMVVSTILSATIWGRYFLWPTPHEAAMLVFIALLGLTGQYFLTLAYLKAEPTVVTPISYFEIAFSGISAWLVLGETPDLHSVLGATIIVAAAVFLVLDSREKPEDVLAEASTVSQ